MRLAHVHCHGPISYARSLALQNALLERHFRYKDMLRGHARKPQRDDDEGDEMSGSARHHPAGQLSPDLAKAINGEEPLSLGLPDPTLLTFSTAPTYTVGRRHLQNNPISAGQQSFLTAGGAATFHASPRGGLLTYHAPGQLTGYLVADLRRLGITPRCWVRLLENSVIRTCAAFGVENTARTDDPGVWIQGTERKICAIGVQVSRGVTSHGVGLNVFDHVIPEKRRDKYDFTAEQEASKSFDAESRGYLSWGFSRIVACGLEGKSVTWLAREQAQVGSGASPLFARFRDNGPAGLGLMASVGDVFAKELAKSINEMGGAGKEKVDSVYRLGDDDVVE